jgi:hypothetical protein
MVAKKFIGLTGKYMFFIDPNTISQNARSYIGTLFSNFFGSFYNLYDSVCSATNKELGRNVLAVKFVFLITQLRTLGYLRKKECANLLQ